MKKIACAYVFHYRCVGGFISSITCRSKTVIKREYKRISKKIPCSGIYVLGPDLVPHPMDCLPNPEQSVAAAKDVSK